MQGISKDFLKLDVGGQIFHVAKTTLQIARPSLLSGIVDQGVNDVVYIDRDPEYFRYILLYLRGYSHFLPKDEEDKIRLRDDAKFYCIAPLTIILDGLIEPSPYDNQYKQEEPWMRDAYIAKLKRSIKSAIEQRKDMWDQDEVYKLDSDRIIYDLLGADKNIIVDDLSSWPINTLKELSEKSETIELRMQIIADITQLAERHFGINKLTALKIVISTC